MKTNTFKINTLIAAGGLLAGALALSLSVPTFAAGPDDSTMILDGGQEIVTDLAPGADSPLDRLYSGWRFRSPETQALQLDDFENPAFPAVDTGETLWNTVEGTEGKSCAACHDNAEVSMKGVRAQFPKWNAALQRPHTMETQVNECRTERMGAEKWKWESKEMLAMTAYVGLQSRGMPVNIDASDPGMAQWLEKGKEVYYTRVGQLNMSCANCHEENYGTMIRADHLSQGQINGFPVYRLKWGGLGSAQRRFKGCMANIRATPYKVGGDEFTALEAYLASRGNGLSVETPSVRN
ncbi:MAG: sulfur oxidation c-type cytochrome SoxA [Rhizobiaceae bacterium]|nr:sulfur oxidation c-type cytochrome SoxA [Rhizobiaceae bacterium]